MYTSVITSLGFAALAFAAPPTIREESKPSENIDISDFLVRKYVQDDGSSRIDVVDFKLKGNDADGLSCTAQKPAFPTPSEVTTCGESKYRFSLHAGSSDDVEFSLRVYHELGTAVGYWGQGAVPTYCRAGGNGAGDYVCSQTGEVTIVIDSTPPPTDP